MHIMLFFIKTDKLESNRSVNISNSQNNKRKQQQKTNHGNLQGTKQYET